MYKIGIMLYDSFGAFALNSSYFNPLFSFVIENIVEVVVKFCFGRLLSWIHKVDICDRGLLAVIFLDRQNRPWNSTILHGSQNSTVVLGLKTLKRDKISRFRMIWQRQRKTQPTFIRRGIWHINLRLWSTITLEMSEPERIWAISGYPSLPPLFTRCQ